MRPWLFVVLMNGLAPALAGAQPLQPPVSRADVAVATGWFTADRSARDADCCSSGWSAALFKGAAAGYYWTDHVKTEVGFAALGRTEGFSSSSALLPNGVRRYISERHQID